MTKQLQIRGEDIQCLLRQGYVEFYKNEDLRLTQVGEAVFTYFNIEPDIKLPGYDKAFEEFWQLYPSSDAIPELGIQASRILRTDKKGCKVKYEKILKNGEINHEQVIKALKNEIEFRKKNQKLCYMRNSKTWLNQEGFNDFIEFQEDELTEESSFENRL